MKVLTVAQILDPRDILIFQFLTESYAFNDQRLELSSVWALLAAFEDPLPIPHNDSRGVFEGAFVRDVDSLLDGQQYPQTFPNADRHT